MKVFIDEKRKPEEKYSDYDSWIHINNINEFVSFIDHLIKNNEWVEFVSFDYDSNRYHISLLCFEHLIKSCILKDRQMPQIFLHSDDSSSEGVFKSIGSKYERMTNNKVSINII